MPPELKQIHAAGPTSTKNKGFTFYIWHSFDCFAKRMGAPKGLFSPAWPLLLSLSIIQCVKASQPPTLPPCLFHTAYVVPASHPCHCLLSLITHTQPSCHFVQDADGAVCVCVSALYVKCSIWLSFLFSLFFLLHYVNEKFVCVSDGTCWFNGENWLAFHNQSVLANVQAWAYASTPCR